MIFHDNKKMAGAILSNMSPPMDKKMDMPEPKDESMDSDKEGMRSCAEDLIQALHAKDADGVMSALMDFIDMAKDMPDEDESSEEAPPMPEDMPA